MDVSTHFILHVQELLFEWIVEPVLFGLGMGNLLEDGYQATLWLLMGLIQIALLVCVVGPLERWRPVEPVIDRAAIRLDILYTLVHQLGLFRLTLFFTLDPLWDGVFGTLHVWGLRPLHLDQWMPGLADRMMLSFAVYVIVLDLLGYGFHRLEHRFAWWWALHAVHHSQRQMTMWSDARNHLLDDVLHDTFFVLAAQIIGVPPGQFVALVALTKLVESFSHANLRLGFGRIGERLLVGPRFHRTHHAIGIGHESAGLGTLGGCNYAVLFPVWDILFRTARFDNVHHPTGIRDQLPDEGGHDYGAGFVAQQWLGIVRMIGALRHPTSRG